MNNNKSFKWGYGVAMALTLGLSGCFMDNNQSSQEAAYSTTPDYSTPKNKKSASSEPKATQKSYASKEPTQKATPGPKRTAAPQLPVIQ